jgi:hypothetical protein
MEVIFEEDGKFYFWDEAYLERYGPYPTREIADGMCIKYCLECLGNYSPEKEAVMRNLTHKLLGPFPLPDGC